MVCPPNCPTACPVSCGEATPVPLSGASGLPDYACGVNLFTPYSPSCWPGVCCGTVLVSRGVARAARNSAILRSYYHTIPPHDMTDISTGNTQCRLNTRTQGAPPRRYLVCPQDRVCETWTVLRRLKNRLQCIHELLVVSLFRLTHLLAGGTPHAASVVVPSLRSPFPPSPSVALLFGSFAFPCALHRIVHSPRHILSFHLPKSRLALGLWSMGPLWAAVATSASPERRDFSDF